MDDDVLGELAWTPRGRRGGARSPLSRKRRARKALGNGLTRNETAEATGLSYQIVCKIAREMGIPKASAGPRNGEERNAQIAGEVAKGTHTLAEIGERWGLSRERVRQIAKMAGVNARKGITSEYRDQVIALVGTMSDVEVAGIVGCTASRVWTLRIEAGIPCFKYRPEWYDLLGTVPDMEIVRRFGIQQSTVCQYRNRHGIPPWRECRRIDWDAACIAAGAAGERWCEAMVETGAARTTVDNRGAKAMRERGWVSVHLGMGPRHKQIIGWRREVDDG